MAWIFITFLMAWPFLEIAVLVQIAEILGWFGAILGLALSGFIGLLVLQKNSLTSAANVQKQMNQGQLPMRELFDMAGRAFSGLLLLIPGYLSSALGLLLLIPLVRTLIYGEFALKAKKTFTAQAYQAQARPFAEAPPDVTIIDGDFKVVDSKNHRSNSRTDRGPPLMLL